MIAKHYIWCLTKHLVFSIVVTFHHMINDVFGGKTRSYNRFLVENIIVKGIIPKRKKVHPKDNFTGF